MLTLLLQLRALLVDEILKNYFFACEVFIDRPVSIHLVLRNGTPSWVEIYVNRRFAHSHIIHLHRHTSIPAARVDACRCVRECEWVGERVEYGWKEHRAQTDFWPTTSCGQITSSRYASCTLAMVRLCGRCICTRRQKGCKCTTPHAATPVSILTY